MNLQKLSLSGNKLAILPYSFSNLVNLEELKLDKNSFSGESEHVIESLVDILLSSTGDTRKEVREKAKELLKILGEYVE